MNEGDGRKHKQGCERYLVIKGKTFVLGNVPDKTYFKIKER